MVGEDRKEWVRGGQLFDTWLSLGPGKFLWKATRTDEDTDDIGSEQPYLRRCIELAKEALDAGDEPFGSVVVDAEGRIRAEDRNRVAGGDQTRHPEFELARWAANHMAP